GNHDSPANRRGLARFDNVTVLDPGVTVVDGLRLAGIGHPAFTASNELEDDEVEALVAEEEPDVLVVHDPDQAATVLGEVPLVLAGHVHEHRVTEEDGTIVETSGSTGATGLGAFTVDTDQAYEASVLRFVDGRLRAIDAVSLQGTNGDFRLDRQLFEPPDEV
ncbi:MAG TPA: hypothetical protein VD926_05230, partial [Acidimicrobiales bacterium]|nr:hypothetical protein [Acidimicrobiales bacterium]